MRILLVFVFGVALGALGYYLYEARPQSASAAAVDSGRKFSDNARDAARTAANRTREFASEMSETLGEKISAWHLTRDDIRGDLAKTGEVVRNNAARAGEKMADARIVAVIKAKFVLDRDLSVHAIDVRSENGDVTLTGNVASEALIGKAVAHALDTEGVHHVVAKLRVQAPAP